MTNISRRQFVKGSIAAMATITIAGTKSSGRVLGANDTIRIGVAGLNGRGGEHVGDFASMQDVEITYLIDPDTRTYDSRIRQLRRRLQSAAHRAGHSPGSRRSQRRRDLDRHAEPLARPDDDLGLPGGQGCLRREAVQPQRPRRPHRRRDGPASTTSSCSTARRAAREGALGQHHRSDQVGHATASCSSRAACATSCATASACGPMPIRPPSSISTSGSGRPSARLPHQSGPLQLALVLGLRQRRHRQPRRPPDGHRPLGHPGRHACRAASSASAAASATPIRAKRRTRRSPSWTSATPN